MSTGDLCEIPEVKYEWKIKDFPLLPHEKNEYYESPVFSFCGSSWMIWIYPNGDTVYKSEGWIDLFLFKVSGDNPVKVNFSFSWKTVDGESIFDRTATTIFDKNNAVWGFFNIISRSELIERKTELLPSDVLTVTCTLFAEASGSYSTKKKNVCFDAVTQTNLETEKKNVCVDAVTQTNQEKEKKNVCVDAVTQTNQETGVWKLQHQFKKILLNGNVSDVVLAVGDREFKSHWSILAARSPVFLAMTTHDTTEKNSGVVDIPDVDPNTFSDFLNYLYTGSVENVTPDNVAKLYTAADKYQVDDLKKECVDFMLKNTTVDNFCDLLTVSLLHVEKELTDACSLFFMKNSLLIVLTSKWQAFLVENPITGNELYIKQLQQKQ